MPIYEYVCEKCGCEFEVRQSFDDKSLVRCPKCKGIGKRIMSSFSFAFAQPKSKVTDRARPVGR